MKFLGVIVIKFFLISALFIISNGNLHIKDSVEREQFFDAYSSWIKNVVTQSTDIVNYALNSQWLPHEGRLADSFSLVEK